VNPTSQEPKYVAETLAWCNARRKERGKRPLTKLPKGERNVPHSCPCGTATNCSVFGFTYRVASLRAEYPLPRSVQRFVRAFDDGRLPQYEAKS
jgi:hypothetical protein